MRGRTRRGRSLARRARRAGVALALLGAAALPPTPARAQEPVDLTIEAAWRRVVVQPRPAPAVVAEDAERAATAAARERAAALAREAARPQPPRPDLRYDVYATIQARGVRGALR